MIQRRILVNNITCSDANQMSIIVEKLKKSPMKANWKESPYNNENFRNKISLLSSKKLFLRRQLH